MDHRKERIKSGCQKILEGINSMSLVNLDDQQVHSLVMMREIAREVVDDPDRKVTKSDVITALRHNIEIMVKLGVIVVSDIHGQFHEAFLKQHNLKLLMRLEDFCLSGDLFSGTYLFPG